MSQTQPSADHWWFEKKWASFRRGTFGLHMSWDGGSASGVLYNDGVPKTSSAFAEHLPLEVGMINVAWSGSMLMGTTTVDLNIPEPENEVRLVRPGDVTWDHKVNEICVVYGDAECRLPSGPNTVVVIGSLTTGLEDLAAFGRRRRFEGVGNVRLEAIATA